MLCAVGVMVLCAVLVGLLSGASEFLIVLVVCFLVGLVFGSLLTAVERRCLASGQRRSGPSYCGWFGLLQVVGDGLKLCVKTLSDAVQGMGVSVGVVLSMAGAFVGLSVLVCGLAAWHGVLSCVGVDALGFQVWLSASLASWVWQVL